MKKLLLLLLLAIVVNAQNVTIKSIEQVTNLEQGAYFHPVAGPTGQLLFTGVGYVGLYLMDVAGNLKTLSEAPGAGYEPTFSGDGNFVYFRPYNYNGSKKLSSLVKKSISGNDEQVLIKDERDFTSAKRLLNGSIAVSRNSDFYITDASQQVEKNESLSNAVFLEKGQIALYKNGEKEILTPMGEGYYLWVSISPDGSKLLFTKTGEGTFISDIYGTILTELGYANAPQWSPDANWVVYMRDLDDGHQITESDILITSSDGKTTIPITETSDTNEVYPVWGVENEIVFGSENGIIYKAIIEID